MSCHTNTIASRFLAGLLAVLAPLSLSSLQAQLNYATPYTITTLAGSAARGSADGTGSNARFLNPQGVAVDGLGNIYVADNNNHTIRKITSAGVVTTIAGQATVAGSADGTGSAARFFHPRGVAVDGAGNLYVADADNHTIRKITPAGMVTTLAGLAGASGSADGTGSGARLMTPEDVAVDNSGNLYVADSGNNTIRKITSVGVVTTLAGPASFYYTGNVAVDGTGNVYFTDANKGMVFKITPAGAHSTLAGQPSHYGSADGTGSEARFSNPRGVAVDDSGNVYVVDAGNYNIRQITSTGVVTTLAGSAGSGGETDGTGSAARFYEPTGIAADRFGNFYVADRGNNTIRKVTAGGVVTTLAGIASTYGSADGTGSAAQFRSLVGMAVDGTGNIYVVDQNFGQGGTVRKITPAGAVTTLAGSATANGSADGMGSSARFSYPTGAAVDTAGNIYVADSGNRAIRKINPAGMVTTLAGGDSGSLDGTGTAAKFGQLDGIAVDGSGNVYVVDSSNNTIRKITSVGVVTTLAGTADYYSPGSLDGTGSAARFYSPRGIAVDSSGNLYVVDGSHTIRKITPAGVVTTLAGTASSLPAGGAADGMGTNALFNQPSGVAIDASGNLYVTDSGNCIIRKITPAGLVTTLAGNVSSPLYGPAYGSEDGTGTAAYFSFISAIAVDGSGNLYVADVDNATIRKGVLAILPPSDVVITITVE